MSWSVKAAKPGMSATYACPTAEVALAQVRYFARKDYISLSITGPDGTEVTVAQLEAVITPAEPGDVPPPSSELVSV